MNELEASKVYNYLYSHAHDRGMYGAYPRRDSVFAEFIREHVVGGSYILDAGCGRGFLVRWLRDLGYSVLGTEIADCLFKPGGELFGMPAVQMYYSDLYKFGSNSFPVVISNDVLEHLEDEVAVITAMAELTRIAGEWLLISTGGTRASRCPFPKELGVANLHSVVRPEEWWVELYSAHCSIHEKKEAAGSIFLFGAPV